jgi:hypothetical protein
MMFQKTASFGAIAIGSDTTKLSSAIRPELRQEASDKPTPAPYGGAVQVRRPVTLR